MGLAKGSASSRSCSISRVDAWVLEVCPYRVEGFVGSCRRDIIVNAKRMDSADKTVALEQICVRDPPRGKAVALECLGEGAG